MRIVVSSQIEVKMVAINEVTDAQRLHTVRYCQETVVTYAQNMEDVLLFRAFGGQHDGSFIDVGAGHPIFDNITWWMYTCGWRGVNVEPNPTIFQELDRYRPYDKNVNSCVSATASGQPITYHHVKQNEVGHGWGLSSCDPAGAVLARSLGFDSETIELPSTTLATIADTFGLNTPDLVKIDVEGFEREVLLSAKWDKFRPRLFCIEAVRPNSAQPCFSDWEDILLGRDYVFAAFDGVNSYYAAREQKFIIGQLSAPVCCNDRYRRAERADIEAAHRHF